jgi:peptidoglycan/LPS O-acetylase OafA/YrhL
MPSMPCYRSISTGTSAAKGLSVGLLSPVDGGVESLDTAMGKTETADRHILPLDGLRGLAILLVFAFHGTGQRETAHSALMRAFTHVASWGYTGVNLFFVLSGFLITRILLKTRDAENFYQVFYVRRVLRIFPLYYIAVILAFLVLPKLGSHFPSLSLWLSPVPLREQIWFWLNISNFRTAFNPAIVPLLSHFWSLAIEEQFYFVWPSIVRRLTDRALGWVCFGGILLPLILRVSEIVPTFGAPDFYYRVTPFHMEGLCAGAALALLNARGNLHRYRAWFVTAIAVGCLGIGCTIHWSQVAVLQRTVLTLCAIVFFGLIGLCLLGARGSFGLSKVFSVGPLRTMGSYSYFIYVFHVWVLVFVQAAADSLLRNTWMGRRGEFRHLFEMLISLLILVATGALSKRYIEDPILGLKRFFSYGRRQNPTGAPLAEVN